MNVVLELEPELEAILKSKAEARKSPVNQVVVDLIKSELALEAGLAPFRKEFGESAMTEDEVDDFLDDLRTKAFKDRHPNGRHP